MENTLNINNWSLYRFRIRSGDSQRVKGVIAPSLRAAELGCGARATDSVEQLPVNAFESAVVVRTTKKAVNARQLYRFWLNMGYVADAKQTPQDGVRNAAMSATDPLFRGILGAMLEGWEENRYTYQAEAFQEFRGVAFDDVSIALVEASEQIGSFGDLCRMNAKTILRGADFAKRVRGALVEPCVTLGVGIIAALFMSIVVLPGLAKNFTAMGSGELPGITLALLAFGNFMRAYPWVGILFGVALFLVFARRKQIAKSPMCQRAMVRVPKLGELVLMASFARSLRVLSMLIGSRIPVEKAFPLCSKASGHVVISEYFDSVQADIENNIAASPADAFGMEAWRLGEVGDIVSAQSEIGGKTGNMDEQYRQLSDSIDRESEETADEAIPVIKYTAMAGAFAIAGFVIVATALPMMTQTKGLADKMKRRTSDAPAPIAAQAQPK